MSTLNKQHSLKEIIALKKKITWGDVPAIFHMISSSISDLEGILTHGFDSAYKDVLNRNSWNLSLLQGHKDQQGNICVTHKPKISLHHEYNNTGYELHCYPMVNQQKLTTTSINDPHCPFHHWYPEKMQMLFRINNLVAFSIFTYQSGDEADMALVKYSYFCVEKLINILKDSFEIIDIDNYNIAGFYQEIHKRKGNILSTELFNQSNN